MKFKSSYLLEFIEREANTAAYIEHRTNRAASSYEKKMRNFKNFIPLDKMYKT